VSEKTSTYLKELDIADCPEDKIEIFRAVVFEQCLNWKWRDGRDVAGEQVARQPSADTRRPDDMPSPPLAGSSTASPTLALVSVNTLCLRRQAHSQRMQV
jgi:hypothetical protein